MAQPLLAVLCPIRWERSARVIVGLSYCFSRSKRESNSRPSRHSPGRSTEVTRTFTTPECFCGGNHRPETDQCSAAELRQLSPPVGVEPTTVGSDVTRACTTPQTLKSFPYFPTSLLHYFPHARTPLAFRFFKDPRRQEIREELAHGETAFSPGEHCVLPRPKKRP